MLLVGVAFPFMLPAAAPSGQELSIELILFSGRPRPKVVISDSSVLGDFLDSLSARKQFQVPWNDIPKMNPTPSYIGVLLTFSTSVPGFAKAMVVRDGYILYDSDDLSYRDPGRNLERMAVSLAFTQEDRNAPGGPRPMEYLACMVPNEMHPDVHPCTTSNSAKKIQPPSQNRRLPGRGFSFIGLDGRTISERSLTVQAWIYPIIGIE